ALRSTKAGLNAIELEDTSQTSDRSARADTMAVVAADVSKERKRSARAARAKPLGGKKTAADRAKPTKASSDRVNSGSKQDRILALLQRPKGATLDVLTHETQWQKHSVRGFLAGTVRKKLKLPLLSEKIDGVRTYRIGGSRVVKANKKRRRA